MPITKIVESSLKWLGCNFWSLLQSSLKKWRLQLHHLLRFFQSYALLTCKPLKKNCGSFSRVENKHLWKLRHLAKMQFYALCLFWSVSNQPKSINLNFIVLRGCCKKFSSTMLNCRRDYFMVTLPFCSRCSAARTHILHWIAEANDQLLI